MKLKVFLALSDSDKLKILSRYDRSGRYGGQQMMTDWTLEDIEELKRRNPDFRERNPELASKEKTSDIQAHFETKQASTLEEEPSRSIYTQNFNDGGKNEAKIREEMHAATKRNHPEKELEQFVHDAAKACGLLYYHTYHSRFSEPGFPDCLIIGSFYWLPMRL